MRLWLMIMLVLTAVWISGCTRCHGDQVMARLEQSQGPVERDHADELGAFSAALVGAEFRLGDAVKTGHAASALLALDDGSKALLEEDTLLRFSVSAPGGPERGFDVETGMATLEVGSRALYFHTSVGTAVLDAGTRLRISPKQQGVSFSVVLGLARFETRDGALEVRSGDAISIAIGGAVLELTRAETASPVAQSSNEAASDDPSKAEPSTGISAVVSGGGARVRNPDTEAWRALTAGTVQLAPGSVLELDQATSAALTSQERSVRLHGKGSFILGAANAPFIQTTAGRVLVDPAQGGVSIAVPGGTIIVRPQARAELNVGSPQGTSLRVDVGSADVAMASAAELIAAGESAQLSSSGTLRVNGRGPRHADMHAAPGTSFVVHDPHPPTSIGFRLGEVCRAGVVERLHTASHKVLASSRGDAIANLLFPPGTHRYHVRCIEAQGIAETPGAKGSVTILRDTGTGALSRIPPMSRVDMDGRNYTVTYQNLLPKIAVRWQKAPTASSYNLSVQSRHGKRTFSSSKPAYNFAAGQFPEGNYSLQFGTQERASPETKLVVRFDNAAPTARIQSPQDGTFQPGTSVTLAGVAVPGWSVRAAGRELPLDAQSRFSVQVTSPTEQRALQLLFSHPQRGTHYYLRRAVGASL